MQEKAKRFCKQCGDEVGYCKGNYKRICKKCKRANATKRQIRYLNDMKRNDPNKYYEMRRKARNSLMKNPKYLSSFVDSEIKFITRLEERAIERERYGDRWY